MQLDVTHAHKKIASSEADSSESELHVGLGSRLLPVRALLMILSMGHRHNTRLKKKSRHIGMDYRNHGYIFYYDSLPDDYYLAEQKENITRLRKYKKKRLVQKRRVKTMLVQRKD
jgi:hypothetical protein